VDTFNCNTPFWEAGQETIIFFLGAQPGDKNFLQTNGVPYFYAKFCMCINL
jgi:hypothetical protein